MRALGPIAAGHVASVASVVLLLVIAGSFVSTDLLRIAGGVILVAFGLYKFLAPFSHPRWVGMRVTARELGTWSFLMATAHGAGLMLIPLLVRSGGPATVAAQEGHEGHASHAEHMAAAGVSASRLDDLVGIGIHTAAMFAVMALIAVVVYEKVGLTILRKAWFNLDRVWAGALVTTGVLTIAL